MLLLRSLLLALVIGAFGLTSSAHAIVGGQDASAGEYPYVAHVTIDKLGVAKDARGNAKAIKPYTTSVENVFAAGDARRGQSLIVWAINEGRQCARMVDRHLRELAARDPRADLSAGTSQRAGSPDLGADPPQRAANF